MKDFIDSQKQKPDSESKLTKLMKGVSGHDNKIRLAQEEKIREVIKANLSNEEIVDIWNQQCFLS